jgi:cyclophilin family peptidyl-prolyl cis-trans isomerase
LVAASAFADSKQVLSSVYAIEKKYRSMEGPSGVQTVYLGDPDKPELVWLTGIRTEVVGEDGKTLASPELMCHMNIDIDAVLHRTMFHLERMPARRLLTLSQGMLAPNGGFTARLPRGFGFPFSSTEPFVVFTQVLNHNIEHPHLKVRHRVTFEYVRDADLKQPLKPLFNVGASALVVLSERPTMMIDMHDSGGEHGMSCLAMPRAPNAMAMGADYTDPQGRKMTGHWVVPPGHQENHSDIGWFLGLPYDTKIHYAAVHLHPYAESLTLRDTTTGQTLFSAQAKNPKGRVGLDHVDTFVSDAGLPLYKDHKYELVSVYDNTSGVDQDSMASMFFGLSDPEFVKPTPTELAARKREAAADRVGSFLLHTNSGDVLASFQRDVAPATSRMFVKLLQNGGFRNARVSGASGGAKSAEVTFSAPMSEAAMNLLPQTALDAKTKHADGSVSLCPGTKAGEVSITMLLGNAHDSRDGRCVAFARVIWGEPLLREIVAAPRAARTSVEVTRIDLVGDGGDVSGMQLVEAKPIVAR